MKEKINIALCCSIIFAFYFLIFGALRGFEKTIYNLIEIVLVSLGVLINLFIFAIIRNKNFYKKIKNILVQYGNYCDDSNVKNKKNDLIKFLSSIIFISIFGFLFFKISDIYSNFQRSFTETFCFGLSMPFIVIISYLLLLFVIIFFISIKNIFFK